MGRGSLLSLHSKKFLLLALCAPKGKVLGEREPRLDWRPPSCSHLASSVPSFLASSRHFSPAQGGSVPFHVTVCMEMGKNRGKDMKMSVSLALPKVPGKY